MLPGADLDCVSRTKNSPHSSSFLLLLCSEPLSPIVDRSKDLSFKYWPKAYTLSSAWNPLSTTRKWSGLCLLMEAFAQKEWLELGRGKGECEEGSAPGGRHIQDIVFSDNA